MGLKSHLQFRGSLLAASLFICGVQLVLQISAEDAKAPPIVTLEQGKLSGAVLKARGGRDYYAFTKIPYAQQVRFKEAIPWPKWEGTLDATGSMSGCPQLAPPTLAMRFGVEDCLKAYVYTPTLNRTAKLPVMLYIHGGAFSSGSGEIYYADYFMEGGDVVIVTYNYRFGALGFLSTGDDVIPGNLAIKDGILMLQWIQRNIEAFGGDKNSVTIFGNSAGGALTNYMLVVPQAKGLFHAAIPHSGAHICPWSIPRKNVHQTKKFAKAIGCNFTGSGRKDSLALLKCLEDPAIDVDKILDATAALVEYAWDPVAPFGVELEEKDWPGAVVTEHPEVLLREGRFTKVPMIVLQVEDEGFLIHAGYILSDPELTRQFNEEHRRVYPITLQYGEMYHPGITQETLDKISDKLRLEYLNNTPISVENYYDVMDLYSDMYLHHGIRKSARLYAKHTDVWMIYFSHKRRDFSVTDLLGAIPAPDTVTHGDEVSFLFNKMFHIAPEFLNASASEAVSKNFIKLWVSFAKNKKPTHWWPKVQNWQKMTQEEADGKVPIHYLRLDSKNQIIVEPQREVINHKMLDKLFKETGILEPGRYHFAKGNKKPGSG